MEAVVYKIHSDFYYVKPKQGNGALLECKLREILKKQQIKIKVGDFVEIDKAGAVSALLPRKNTLGRPNVSNLDLVVVVSSFLEPAVDFTQLDRYLTFLKYNKINALLCFNKDDLLSADKLAAMQAQIRAIYEPLGYKILFTSALLGGGLKHFEELIKGKTIAFCGLSGVGKSSILSILSGKNLRTGEVGKNKRGVHTTRHTEIIELDDAKIIDTPGFSRLAFDFILPKDLTGLFDDIKYYAAKCRYSDCLHTKNDDGCAVIKNLDKIPKSRYKSYLDFLKEAKEYKQKVIFESQKPETAIKLNQNKNYAKISGKKRDFSRKKLKQKLKEKQND